MKITILGSGAMATACSILLAEHADQEVAMWARNPHHADQMRKRPGKPPAAAGRARCRTSWRVTADLRRRAGRVGLARGRHSHPISCGRTLTETQKSLNRNRPVISVVKGLENETLHAAQRNHRRSARQPGRRRPLRPEPCRGDRPPAAGHAWSRRAATRAGPASAADVQHRPFPRLHQSRT